MNNSTTLGPLTSHDLNGLIHRAQSLLEINKGQSYIRHQISRDIHVASMNYWTFCGLNEDTHDTILQIKA